MNAMAVLLLLTAFSFLEICGMKKKAINIFMATDDGYVRPTIVALTSLLKNGNSRTFFQIALLVPGRLKTDGRTMFDSLQEKYKNCKIAFVDMGEKYKNAPRMKINAPTYYRLDIPSLFPNMTKCIFLDGDVMVRHDLSEMYDIDIENYYLSAVRSGRSLTKAQIEKKVKSLEMPDYNRYVCTGVMIMNLELMRRDGIEERFSQFIKKKKGFLGKANFYAEQDVLNAVCYEKILPLPHEFGFLINLLSLYPEDVKKSNPAIVHFAAGPKPWSNNRESKRWSDFHEEWWNYTKMTTLYDEKMDESKDKDL